MVPALSDISGDRLDAARAAGAATRDRLARRPGTVAAFLSSTGLAYAAYRLFEPLPPGRWPRLRDSMLFEYIGWYVTRGNRLYVDVWEIKPPLSFEVTAVLALLAGQDVVLYHVLNLLANAVAVAAGAAAAAGIVHELTDDPLAAVTAGVAPFALPFYFYRALIGFKAKYFVVAAGLGCLYLAYRRRPFAAGAAGAAAVGFWQLAAVFPLAALGLCWQRDGREGARRVLAGSAIAGGVVLLPVLAWGALPAMVTEVLLVPFVIAEGHAFTDRVQFVLRILGRALPVALVGVAGLVGAAMPGRIEREWPLVLAGGWLTVQVVALNFDARPDLFPWLALAGVGVGLAVATRERPGLAAGVPGSRAVAAAILVFAALSVATMGGFGTGRTGLTSPETYDTATEIDPTIRVSGYNALERQYIYWNRVEIPTCRALGAYSQARLVNRAGLAPDRPWYEAPCGRLRPVLEAILSG